MKAINSVSSAAITLCGVLLCLVPPALWIAWTETVFLVVVAVGTVSAALLVLLADMGEPDAQEPRTPREAFVEKAIASEAVAEIHRIFPLTYHHSLVEKARFRRAMDKVRQLIPPLGDR